MDEREIKLLPIDTIIEEIEIEETDEGLNRNIRIGARCPYCGSYHTQEEIHSPPSLWYCNKCECYFNYYDKPFAS